MSIYRFCVILDAENKTVTLRTEPSLALVKPQIKEEGRCLVLDAPGMDPLSIRLAAVVETEKQATGFR